MSRLKTSFSVTEKHSAFFTGGQIQLTRDGSRLICACGKQLKVLSVKTGHVISTFGQDEEEDISRFILTSDDEFLVIATQNQLFRQWRIEDNVLVKTWKSVHTAPVTSMAFDPTVTLLASGSADSTIKVWDITRGYFTHNFKGHTGVVRVTAYHPDPERLHLVSAAEDYTVRVWDLKTSSCILTSQCHVSLVTSIAFAENGDSMYSTARDNVVCVWKTDKWKVFKTIPVFETIVSLIVPSDFPGVIEDDNVPRVVTVASNGYVRVLNTQTGKKEYSNNCRLSDATTEEEEANEYITQSLYSDELGGILFTTYDQNIVLLSNDFTQQKQMCGHLDEILDVRFLGENNSHIAVASNTDLLKVFTRDTWECQMLQGHSDIITSLDVKGNFVVTGSKDCAIQLWQFSQDSGFVTCIGTGQGHTQAVQSVALARSKERPAFLVSGGLDMTLKLWRFPAESDLSPRATLRVIATERAHDKDINCIDVAPNDKLIATGSHDKTGKLWSVGNDHDTLTLLAVLRGHKRGIWGIRFSPVDQAVATCSGDGFIKMWSVTDYSCLRTLEGHDSSVLSITFMSQGRQILSSGSDGLLKLWLIKTSECLKTFEGHDAKIWALTTSAKEDFALSGGADSTLIVWKDVTEEEETEKQEKLQKQVLQEQVLSNLITDKKYVRALGLAISLNKPFHALNIIKEITKDKGGEKQLEDLIHKFRMDQIESLLKFATQWNTNSHNCFYAQLLLNLVLKNFLPGDLIKLPGIQTIVEAFTVYTERHLQRLDNLLIDSHFAEYCHGCMKTAVNLMETNTDEMDAT